MPFVTLQVQYKNSTDHTTADMVEAARELASDISEKDRVHMVQLKEVPEPSYRNGEAQ